MVLAAVLARQHKLDIRSFAASAAILGGERSELGGVAWGQHISAFCSN
jgi:hypothetical protein